MRPYANAGAAVNVLGMVAVTGVPETWLVEVHPSFGSIEDLDRGLSALSPVGGSDADLLAPTRTMIALYRHGWSYRPVDAIRMLPRARYFELTVYWIRAGTEADFGEVVRQRRAGADSINLDRPDLAYQVVSGAPGRMFVFLAPLTSLRTIDEGMMQLPGRAESAGRAAQGVKVASDAEISREHVLLRVDPRISYVSDAFAEADPAFWRGRANGQ